MLKVMFVRLLFLWVTNPFQFLIHYRVFFLRARSLHNFTTSRPRHSDTECRESGYHDGLSQNLCPFHGFKFTSTKTTTNDVGRSILRHPKNPPRGTRFFVTVTNNQGDQFEPRLILKKVHGYLEWMTKGLRANSIVIEKCGSATSIMLKHLHVLKNCNSINIKL